VRVADTSALYALFFEEDAHHSKAHAFLADGEAVLIPAEILAETVWLLDRKFGHLAAREAGATLRRLPNVEVQPSWDDPWDNVLGQAWLEYQAGRGKLSYADAVVVAWCRKRRLKPWTYDKHIESLAGAEKGPAPLGRSHESSLTNRRSRPFDAISNFAASLHKRRDRRPFQ